MLVMITCQVYADITMYGNGVARQLKLMGQAGRCQALFLRRMSRRRCSVWRLCPSQMNTCLSREGLRKVRTTIPL